MAFTFPSIEGILDILLCQRKWVQQAKIHSYPVWGKILSQDFSLPLFFWVNLVDVGCMMSVCIRTGNSVVIDKVLSSGGCGVLYLMAWEDAF